MCVLRCVCVNVNTTDATAGATALLLPAQNSLSTIIIGTQTLQLANGRGAGLAASRGGVWRAGNLDQCSTRKRRAEQNRGT